MEPEDTLRRAIQMVQDGDRAPAAAMLERLVADDELDKRGQAAALVWLAETRDDPVFKRGCLERALTCQPDNDNIRQALRHQRETPSAPKPQLPVLPSRECKTLELDYVPEVAGVEGGVNAPASGVFVNDRGLLATTSYALGSVVKAQIRIGGAQSILGSVVRRFPLYDLALISAPVRLARKPALSPPTLAPQSGSVLALSAAGARLRGQLVAPENGIERHWLRTTLPPVTLPDAGGNPLYDERGQLIGLLTRNVDAQGNAMGISVAQMSLLIERTRQARKLHPGAAYCPSCGGLTRARLYGGRSCEICGAALAVDRGQGKRPAQREKLLHLYGERRSAPCPHCGARVGRYRRQCLRCGRAASNA